MIKAAFFDVDNTLYDWANRRFVDSAIVSIKQMQKKGVKVFLCSSRPYDSMKKFGCFDLGIHWDGWVASSGGCAKVGRHFVYKELMNPKDVRAFIRLAKKNGLMMEYITPTKRIFTGSTNEHYDQFASDYEEPPCPIHDYQGGESTGFLLFAPEEADPILTKAFPHLIYYRFHHHGVDVMPVPHSKGKGIAAVLKHLGFSPDEGIGFGDDDPDIGMKDGLTHLVALGNAKETVKAAAEYVTDRIENDGIAKAIKHYGLI